MKKQTISLRNHFSLRSVKIFAILTLLCGSMSSCFKQFYQTNTVHVTDAGTLEQLTAQQ